MVPRMRNNYLKNKPLAREGVQRERYCNYQSDRFGYVTGAANTRPFDRNVLHRTHDATQFDASNARPGATRNDTT